MTISSPGIGSSLDVNSIVSQLMAVERAPLTIITQKTAAAQAKISAFGSIKSALSTFQTAIAGLTDASNIQTFTGVSSDAASATISAGPGAIAGNYALEVSQLAQAQKLVTVGQQSAQTAIGRGTITFDFGSVSNGTLDANGKYSGAAFASNGAGAKTVVIDPSNTSLTGIRDAINNAKIGVTASIVNDGTGAPYRLVLTDASSGKSSSMKISVAGDTALSQLLNHDPASATTAGQALSQTQAAQDALFKIDGIAMSKSSNTVTDAIDGVTLTLLKPTTLAPVALALTGNNAAITTSITQFVSAYNQINKSLKDASSYNATTKVGAVLNGDATVRGVQAQLRAIMTSPIAGSSSATTMLYQIGVSFQSNGTLAVDDAKLQAAIGTNSAAVTGLFAAVGSSSDSLVGFSSAGDKTVPGSYAISVSHLATQGAYAGNSAAGLTVNAGNNALQVQLNGLTASITLTQGTYTTADALANEIQAKINGAAAFSAAGARVSVSATGGKLSIQSSRYGSASAVGIVGGGNPDYFFGTAATPTSGSDVVGTINGVAAGGSGQSLTGATGDASEGLKIQVSGGAIGVRGSINYSQGYAFQFDALLTKLVSSTGSLASKTTGLTASVTSMGKDSDKVTASLTAIEARYRAQFTALDVLMSSMTTTSSFLTQQFASIAKNN